MPPVGGSELSARRRLAVSTVATVSREKFEGEIQAPNSSSETGSSGGARAGAIGGDRHEVGGQAEVFEDVCERPGVARGTRISSDR